jgi:hypothetical protein
LLDHMTVLVFFFFFWGASMLFSTICTNLHSHNVWGFLSPHILTNIYYCLCSWCSHLTGVKWNLNLVLICISFMARDIELFFMCFLTIWVSSFEKHLCSIHLPISSFHHWFFGNLVFWAPYIF